MHCLVCGGARSAVPTNAPTEARACLRLTRGAAPHLPACTSRCPTPREARGNPRHLSLSILEGGAPPGSSSPFSFIRQFPVLPARRAPRSSRCGRLLRMSHLPLRPLPATALSSTHPWLGRSDSVGHVSFQASLFAFISLYFSASRLAPPWPMSTCPSSRPIRVTI